MVGQDVNINNGSAENNAGASVTTLFKPPYNLEAEQALLGAIFVNNEAFYRVGDWLEPEHFYEPLHGRIYEACKAYINGGRAATPITIKDYFKNDEPINDQLTVPQYLGRLAAYATTVINAPEYGQTVYDLAQRRGLLTLANEMAIRAGKSNIDDPVSDVVEDAEKALYKIGDESGRLTTVRSFSAVMREVVSDIDLAYQRDDGLVGLSSGIGPLDKRLGGFADTDLIILGGRTSMGKTTLAVNLAYNIASQGTPVAFFSLEMAAKQLGAKILATLTGTSVDKMRRGKISENEFRQIASTANEKLELPLHTDQQGGLSIAQLSMRARRMKRKWGIKILFVDYLQMMTGSSKGGYSNRVQELTEITSGLKTLAKELEMPIIALSQLSRNLESRQDKRPMLSDLRESGSIEQDADVVLFVYREDYYLKRSKPKFSSPEYTTWATEYEAAKGRSQIIIAKQRHGEIGVVELEFDAARSVFHGHDEMVGM